MVASVPDIRAVDWSPRLAFAGDVVEDFDDIGQCIRIIVTTPRGSDPHRPRFGADLQPYIDMPGDTGVPGLIRAITDAIREWEPRAEVIRVGSIALAATSLATGRRQLRIEWRPKASRGSSASAAGSANQGFAREVGGASQLTEVAL